MKSYSWVRVPNKREMGMECGERRGARGKNVCQSGAWRGGPFDQELTVI